MSVPASLDHGRDASRKATARMEAAARMVDSRIAGLPTPRADSRAYRLNGKYCRYGSGMRIIFPRTSVTVWSVSPVARISSPRRIS